MKNYSKPVSVIANIFQWIEWIGTGLLGLLFLSTVLWSGAIDIWDSVLAPGDSFTVYGVTVVNLIGHPAVLRTMLGYAVLATALYAMVARNITLISRSLAKGPEFGEDNTPFTPDNVRMVREIGLFCISISLWGLVATWVCFGVSGGAVETSWSEMSLLLGLVVLWLSTIFAYGNQLQDDVEGLV